MFMRITRGTRVSYRYYSSRQKAVEGQVRTWVAYGRVFVEIAPLGIMEMGEDEFDALFQPLSRFHSGLCEARVKDAARAGKEG